MIYAIIARMTRRDRWSLIGLVLLILLATALRFYRLDAQDIWGDEAFSISLSQQAVTTVLAGASDTHPPLYPFALWAWLPLVGVTAFATRALSALAGIASVPLIFVFARRATIRARVPWFAAFSAAISPLLIYYSQETRMYELVTVLSLASAYFAARVNTRQRVPYFVVTLLALYTHYSAFFVLAAENLYAVARWRTHRRALIRWFALQFALGMAYVPWLIVQTQFLRGKASARFDEWSWRGAEMIFGKTFLAFAGGLTVDFPIAQIAAVVMLALAALGILSLIQRREASAWLAPLAFSVPVVIAFIVNPIMPFFFERYVLVALPGFLVTVAFGLDALAQRRELAWAGVGALVLISAIALRNYYFDDAYAKGKYGQMMAYVAQHAQPGDALVLNNPLQKPLYQYYAPKNLAAYFLPDGTPLEDPRVRAQLDQIAATHTRLWLVMFGNPAEYDPTGYLERWLGAHAFKSYFGGYVDASLALYDMPGAATSVTRALDATLGESIVLVGYDLDRAEIAPGQTVQLTLHWQTTAPLTKRYTVFAHIIGGMNPATQSPVWAQLDNEPVGGSRPTSTWGVGEMLDDRYGLLLPSNTPPGDYQIEIGMYDPATFARLPVRDDTGARVADDRVLLGTVHVR